MGYADIAVLIPAYQPDERMNTMIEDITRAGFRRIVVIDDGSGEAYSRIFAQAEKLGATVLTHEVNRGKGAGLKTGISHLLEHSPMPIITADSDGQHSPEDIAKIADALHKTPDSLILGTRNKKEMPLRSKLGNTITAFFFDAMTGMKIIDTQTGLRGLPISALQQFAVLYGDRYEYEMNMLLCARQLKLNVEQVPINTIYIDDNSGTHFNGWRDGSKIYALLFRQLLAFVGSSLAAGIVDTAIYWILQRLFPHMIFLSIGVARAISSTMNFIVNRDIVFRAETNIKAYVRYYLLVAFILMANYCLLRVFRYIGMTPLISKLLADFLLFFVNYYIQQGIIFKKKA